MAKEKKFEDKFKFLSPEKFEEYAGMPEEEIVETIKAQSNHLDLCIKTKASSDYLKDIKKDISDFRKDWQKNNAEEWERVNDALKELKDKRDEGIADAIDEQKELEGGLNDAIKGAKEHIEALLYCLRFHR
jgi:gas vesicle protein